MSPCEPSNPRATIGGRAAVVGAFLALAALIPVNGSAHAQEWLQMTTARQVDGAERMNLQVRYAAGELEIGPAEEGLLYRARMRYRGDTFRPLRSYELQEGTARVRLGLEGRNGENGIELDWGDLRDMNLGDLDDDMGEGRLEVGIARGVPTSLDVIVGASSTEMELGGLSLTDVRIRSGASETTVRFDAPNTVRMKRMEVKTGAAEMELLELANARADELRVEGAVGDVTLDFTGEWTADMDVAVKVGVGSLTLRIPSDVGVRLQKSSLLSSFSGFGLEEAEDGSYQSENWGRAEHHLDLSVDAAFGSIDVEQVE